LFPKLEIQKYQNIRICFGRLRVVLNIYPAIGTGLGYILKPAISPLPLFPLEILSIGKNEIKSKAITK